MSVSGSGYPADSLLVAPVNTPSGSPWRARNPVTTLAPYLEAQRVGGDQVEILRATGDREARNEDGANEIPRRMEDIAVRSVDVHEHPQLLAKALSVTKRRLLIIAPWVRGAVVNTEFLAALERRLRAGRVPGPPCR